MGGLYSKVLQPLLKTGISEYSQTDVSISNDVDNSLVFRKGTVGGEGSDAVSTPQAQLLRLRLIDPRSATHGIVRTPILLSTPEDKNSTPQTPRAALPTSGRFLETDLDAKLEGCPWLPSPLNVGSDNSERLSPRQAEPIHNSEISASCVPDPASPHKVVTQPCNPFLEKLKCEEEMPPSEEEEDADTEKAEEVEQGAGEGWNTEPASPGQPRCHKVMLQPHCNEVMLQPHLVPRRELDTLKKKLFYNLEPHSIKQGQVTPKGIKTRSGRTPLGMVCHNRDRGMGPLSPSLLRGTTPPAAKRPWKGIAEERRRLGLENTPPSGLGLALPEVPQSAPGGHPATRASRKHHQALWDPSETTVLI